MKLYGKNNYDMKARYHALNRKVFGGSLPEDDTIRFSWTRLDNMFAMLELGRCADCLELGKDTITFHLDTYRKAKRAKYLDELMLHEMVHLWCLVNDRKSFPWHGAAFKAKACDVMMRFDYNIERDGDWDKFVYTGRATRPILFYEDRDGDILWIPMDYGAVEKFHEYMMGKSYRHCIIEVSKCYAAYRSPNTGMPKGHSGWRLFPGIRRKLFGSAEIRTTLAAGFTNSEARRLLK
jgi:hypothetical protein